MSGYKDLIAWKIADDLAKVVYKTSAKFPKDETYGLTSQLRRASLSVVLNIVEGYSRNNKKEFKNFLRIALGSLAEAGYLLDFAFEQKYFLESSYSQCKNIREECGRVLWRLYSSQ